MLGRSGCLGQYKLVRMTHLTKLRRGYFIAPRAPDSALAEPARGARNYVPQKNRDAKEKNRQKGSFCAAPEMTCQIIRGRPTFGEPLSNARARPVQRAAPLAPPAAAMLPPPTRPQSRAHLHDLPSAEPRAAPTHGKALAAAACRERVLRRNRIRMDERAHTIRLLLS